MGASAAVASAAPPALDVADGTEETREATAAAPFDPEGVRRSFDCEPLGQTPWQQKLARAKAGGKYGPSEDSWFAPFGPTHGWLNEG